MKHLQLSFAILVWITHLTSGQSIEVIKIDRLEKEIQNHKGILVLNFWASWCVPCVKELPDLYEAYELYREKGVDLMLVSLDFADQKDKALAVLKSKNIDLHTFLLDEIDYNSWIDRIEPRWQGAIPMTLIYYNGKKVEFIDKATNLEHLTSLIQNHLKS